MDPLGINQKTKQILEANGYEFEVAVEQTPKQDWRCVQYYLGREGELVASGSYHENGELDTTGETVLEHILAFKNEDKFEQQSLRLYEVLEALIQLRRKHRLLKFGEKKLDDEYRQLKYYGTGWTEEQSYDVKSRIDIALYETYYEEICDMLKQIKSNSQKSEILVEAQIERE